MFKTSALAAVLGLTLASAASATVVFSDDFNYGTSDVLNVGTPPNVGFLSPNWTAGPTVDYIYGTGYTSDPAGLCREGAGASSGCIDLDGSTFTPGFLPRYKALLPEPTRWQSNCSETTVVLVLTRSPLRLDLGRQPSPIFSLGMMLPQLSLLQPLAAR